MRFSTVAVPVVVALAVNVQAAPVHVARSTDLETRGALDSLLNVFKTIFRGVPRDLESAELDARGGVPPLGSILSALKGLLGGLGKREVSDDDAAALLLVSMLQGRDLDARGGVPPLGSILSALKGLLGGLGKREVSDDDAAALLLVSMLQGRDTELDARGGVPAGAFSLTNILGALKGILGGIGKRDISEDDAAALLLASMLQGRDLDARGGVPAGAFSLTNILGALKGILGGIGKRELSDDDAAALVLASLLQRRDASQDDVAALLLASMLQGRSGSIADLD